MLCRTLIAAGVFATMLGCPVAVADSFAEPAPDPLIGPAADGDAPPAPAAPVDPFAAASAAPVDPFAAASAATKADPATTLSAMLGDQSMMAIANMGLGLSAPPPTDPLAPTNTLMPQYYRMPTGQADSPYVLQTDAPAGPFQRVDAWKGVHALAHGALGRMPRDDLGQPLPGTAPPPGTNIPAGLEQFYVVPDTLLPPPPPPPG